MVTWRELVTEAAERFASLDLPEPDVGARWIGQQATGADSVEWIDLLDHEPQKRQLAGFDSMVERRCGGEPLQYVLGSWGFRSLDLMVDRRVLIPRPETEIVAHHAIAEIRRVAESASDTRATSIDAGLSSDGRSGDGPLVVDLGTGSGAIGLAVAAEMPEAEVWLTDESAEALQVARANLAGLGRRGGAVRIAEGDWFEALPAELAGRVDVIVSNPPYVASVDDLEEQVAAWEPHRALVADDGGTAHLVHLIDGACEWLTGGGALVLEMAPDQVESMVARSGERFVEVEVVIDLAGRERAVVARSPRRG